jgi:hypothetical protein
MYVVYLDDQRQYLSFTDSLTVANQKPPSFGQGLPYFNDPNADFTALMAGYSNDGSLQLDLYLHYLDTQYCIP